MSAFLPEGYCLLREAVERAAAAFFPQEYDGTRISAQEKEKFDRYSEVHLSLQRIEEFRERAKTNPSRWRSKLLRRDASVIEAMEKNAIEDDEIVSIRQRKEAREAFEVASWKRLRQYLWEGRLTAYYFYTNGQLLKLEATGWGGTWADGMHELVASGATETGTLIINEFELEAVLSGNQPEASVRTPQSSETVERDPERGVNRTEKRDGPPAKSAPVRNVTKGEIEAVYRN